MRGRAIRRATLPSAPALSFAVLTLVTLGTAACESPAPEPAEQDAVAGEEATGQTPDSATPVIETPETDPAATDTTGDREEWAVPGGSGPDTAAVPPVTGFDTVFVYFTNPAEDQVPAPRAVPASLNGLRAAFTELLEGPTPAEREAGLHSWFSRQTAGMLRSVRYEDGFAVVDFEDLRPVIPNAVGSAGALMLMGELQATAFQFPAVERVEFRIDGDCDALMAWLQFGCYPIRRATWDPPPGFRTAVRPRR